MTRHPQKGSVIFIFDWLPPAPYPHMDDWNEMIPFLWMSVDMIGLYGIPTAAYTLDIYSWLSISSVTE